MFTASQLMRQKRVVVIDDEADFGGISFCRDSRVGGVRAGTNAVNITETVKLIPDSRNSCKAAYLAGANFIEIIVSALAKPKNS